MEHTAASDGLPPNFRKARRCSVSAEPMNPDMEIDMHKVVIPKSLEAMKRIGTATRSNLLFRNLDNEQHTDVCNAMFERTVAQGDVIIQQGDEGDNFYIVDTGTFHVFVSTVDDAEPRKVLTIGDGGSFGELALLYNAPRAATVVAASDGVLWAVDRVSFRRIVMHITARKRRLYESFLSTVPILQDLTAHERSKIADALDPVEFTHGEAIINQGDTNSECFYILEEGTVKVTKRSAEGGPAKEVLRVKRGGYFGEIALLTDKPRAASVIADGNVKCVALDRAAFVRLMGTCEAILKRNLDNYARYEAELQ